MREKLEYWLDRHVIVSCDNSIELTEKLTVIVYEVSFQNLQLGANETNHLPNYEAKW